VTSHEDLEYSFIQRNAHNDIGRRRFMQWLTKTGLSLATAATLSSSILAGCEFEGSTPDLEKEPAPNPDTLKIGLAGPFSGIGSFLGVSMHRTANTVVAQVNAEGGIKGRKLEIISKDISSMHEGNVIQAYKELASLPDLMGIVLGAPSLQSLVTLQKEIDRKRLMLVTVFGDLHDHGELYPDNEKMRSVFQFAVPDSWNMPLLADYAAARGLSRIGLVYDGHFAENARHSFEKSLQDTPLNSAGAAPYDTNETDFASILHPLERAQAIWTWGLAPDLARLTKHLDTTGQAYTGLEKALETERPQLIGNQTGIGHSHWKALAEEHIAPGTITVGTVQGIRHWPDYKMDKWVKKFTQDKPTGEEHVIADAIASIFKAVEKTGNIAERNDILEYTEKAGRQRYSTLDWEFHKKSHIGRHPDDLVLLSFEHPKKPANMHYSIGEEYALSGEEETALGMTPVWLVHPTLKANTRRYPDLIPQLTAKNYGLQNNPADTLH